MSRITAAALRASADRVYNRTPAESRAAMLWFHERMLAAAIQCGNRKLADEVRAVIAKVTP